MLSVPKEFLNDSTLPIRALEIALKIGLSYIELAEIGLDALEYWIRVKNDIIHKYLHLILPPLQDYLLLDSFNYEKKIVSRYDQSFTFKERVATNKVAKASVLEQVSPFLPLFHSPFVRSKSDSSNIFPSFL